MWTLKGWSIMSLSLPYHWRCYNLIGWDIWEENLFHPALAVWINFRYIFSAHPYLWNGKHFGLKDLHTLKHLENHKKTIQSRILQQSKSRWWRQQGRPMARLSSLRVKVKIHLLSLQIQGFFLTGPPPKKLEYGKPRLGKVRCI